MSTPASEMNFNYSGNNRGSVQTTAISAAEPWQWIMSGLETYKKMPALSLLYGGIFAALVAAVYALSSNVPWFTLSYLTGLVVLGPVIASGLYVANRDSDAGNRPSIKKSIQFLKARKTNLALFSLVLGVIMAAWIRFSALVFAIKFNTMTPGIEAYTAMLSSPDGLITMAYFAGIGLLLVSVVFLFSAFAVPLILDKDVNFIEAMKTSYNTVTANPKAMLMWAFMILCLTAFGVATAFVGLALVFPLLGYATWESYKSLVK
jgi:uncharacterized membrane protein